MKSSDPKKSMENILSQTEVYNPGSSLWELLGNGRWGGQYICVFAAGSVCEIKHTTQDKVVTRLWGTDILVNAVNASSKYGRMQETES